MNANFNYAAQPMPLRRPARSSYANAYAPMGQLPTQDTLIKWVVIPGATMGLLWIVTRIIRRGRRRRKRR